MHADKRGSRTKTNCPNPTGNPKCSKVTGPSGLCQSCAMRAAWARKKADGWTSMVRAAPLMPSGAPAAKGKGLDALTDRIAAEFAALVADSERIVSMIRGEVASIKARNLKLLRLAVASRRKIARLARSLKSARASAATARLAEEAEAPEEEEDDDDDPT